MTKLPCDVVRDILPLYHDGVCSDTSRAMVAEHLASCETCQKEWQSLTKKLPLPPDICYSEQQTFQRFAHFWKRTTSKAFRKGILLTLLLCVLGAGGIWALCFWQVQPAGASALTIRSVSQLDDGTIACHMVMNDNYQLRTVHYTMTEQGELYLTPYRPILKQKRHTNLPGLADYTYKIHPNEMEQQYDVALQAIYFGTPQDRVLIWQENSHLPIP